MVFEPRELSLGRVMLCLALIGASIGLGFLFAGPDAMKWIGLLLVTIPIVLLNVVVRGLRSPRRDHT
jgi:ABC-type Fe3+ transport system permease subunit